MGKLLDMLKDLLDSVAPRPEPQPIPVRVTDRRPGR